MAAAIVVKFPSTRKRRSAPARRSQQNPDTTPEMTGRRIGILPCGGV